MKRLTIDEVIAHCKRHIARQELFRNKEDLENGDMESFQMKEYWEHRQVKEWLEELKEYKTAEEQGLLLKPPCKTGDTVWCIFESEVYEGKAEGFNICVGNQKQYVNIEVAYDIVDPFYNDGRLMHRHDPKRFGKTVFLTKKEAKQALAEMKGV